MLNEAQATAKWSKTTEQLGLSLRARPLSFLRTELKLACVVSGINALVESLLAFAGLRLKTLKSELVWRTVVLTRTEAETAIGRYIDSFYNPVRRHSALDFVSPAMFERHAAQ